MGEDHKESQQEPQDDSLLQTPQPDQAMPTEEERRDDLPPDSEPVEVEVETDGPADVQVQVDNPAAPSDGES